jgi:hypothetical protein
MKGPAMELEQFVLKDGSTIEALELPKAQALGLNDDDAHGDKSGIERESNDGECDADKA